LYGIFPPVDPGTVNDVLAALLTGIKKFDNGICISVAAPFVTERLLGLVNTMVLMALGFGGHAEMLPEKQDSPTV
jgi:hypothetical protein